MIDHGLCESKGQLQLKPNLKAIEEMGREQILARAMNLYNILLVESDICTGDEKHNLWPISHTSPESFVVLSGGTTPS
jgi:hypothetical protein